MVNDTKIIDRDGNVLLVLQKHDDGFLVSIIDHYDLTAVRFDDLTTLETLREALDETIHRIKLEDGLIEDEPPRRKVGISVEEIETLTMEGEKAHSLSAAKAREKRASSGRLEASAKRVLGKPGSSESPASGVSDAGEPEPSC